MEIKIRPAEADDCNAIHQLIHELAVFEKAPDEVITTAEDLQQDGFGEKPVWLGWVATHQNEIIGAAICYNRYSTWKGRRLYLEDLIVTKKYRGNGAGKMLLEACIQFAKNRGYSGMMWQVLDWNAPAIDFYKTFDATFDRGWVNVSLNFKNAD